MKIQSSYLIRAVSNLHPGSGDTNYGIIDKLVQRDAATDLPCIHGSGIKGSIKQAVDAFWRSCIPKKPDKTEPKTFWMDDREKSNGMKDVFGSDTSVNENATHDNTQQGKCVFMDAYLLALPVPTSVYPYALVTAPAIISEFLQKQYDLGATIEGKLKQVLEKISKLEIKDDSPCSLHGPLNHGILSSLGKKLQPAAEYGLSNEELNLGAAFLHHRKHCALVSNTTFQNLCNDLNLPVIARNALDNGQSQNLWYEQVLPRESLFYTYCLWGGTGLQAVIENVLINYPIQLGANASIGYGITKFRKI